MPYSQDQVVAELTSFYEFLVSMYLPKDALKRPPPGGWPSITPTEFSFLRKNDTVIDLLKHIPYIRREYHDDEPFQIYECMACIDFTGKQYETTKYAWLSEPSVGDVANCSFTKAFGDLDGMDYDMMVECPHTASLCHGPVSDSGYFLVVDTRTGALYMGDETGAEREYEDIAHFTKRMKQDFRSLKVLPHSPTMVYRTKPSEDKALRAIYREHGWPSDTFKKDECAAKVAKYLEQGEE